MKPNRMIEELAKIEGWKYVPITCGWIKPSGGGCLEETQSLPLYLTSHDAMQRVIDGLDGDQLKMYELHLYNVVLIAKQTGIQRAILLATPAQKAEAVLKALGLWTTGGEADKGEGEA